MTKQEFIKKHFNIDWGNTPGYREKLESDFDSVIQEEIERRVTEFKEQELPDRNIPFHFEAEISAGIDSFLLWLKSKLTK